MRRTIPSLVRLAGRCALAAFQAILATLVMTAASAAFAAEPFAAPQAADPVTATSAGSLAQVTLSLVIVLAAVFAAAWAVRRLRNFGKFGHGAIEIVADVAVGTKERAVLVQVGKQQLLLGVAPGRVSTLHVLTEPVVIRPNASGSSPPSVAGGGQGGGISGPDFKAILKRSLGL